jgi:hypothetical protein
MNRWWIYQKERFPLLAHGPLIAAFSACAVSFSSLLRGAPAPDARMFLTAFGVCLLMFLQLRIADEFKDAAEDAAGDPTARSPADWSLSVNSACCFSSRFSSNRRSSPC